MPSAVRLNLLIGPVVPVPAPHEVMDALTGVEVTTTAAPHTPSGFQLTFTLSTGSPLHTLFLLAGGASIPILRVIIIVTLNGAPNVLVDGVVTHTQVSPGTDAGHATLSVTGVDLTAVMNLVDFSGVPYPGMPPEARVLLIIAKYAFLGIAPLVVPSVLLDVPIPVQRIPRQQGKDLEYVNKLADDVGYVFYMKPGPVPGLNVAYWGPEIKVGVPQPALNVDMGPHTNVETLSFRFDGESKVLPVLFIQNQETKIPIPIPIPDITPLNPPLGLVPPLPKRIEPITGTAKLSFVQAALIGLTKAARSSDAVFGTGTLDVLRYGRPLEARQLVGVRGAGPAFDGLHYVQSVTHTIKQGEYKQSFTLRRNGLLSTVPAVPA